MIKFSLFFHYHGVKSNFVEIFRFIYIFFQFSSLKTSEGNLFAEALCHPSLCDFRQQWHRFLPLLAKMVAGN
jgi:hypothetical protein